MTQQAPIQTTDTRDFQSKVWAAEQRLKEAMAQVQETLAQIDAQPEPSDELLRREEHAREAVKIAESRLASARRRLEDFEQQEKEAKRSALECKLASLRAQLTPGARRGKYDVALSIAMEILDDLDGALATLDEEQKALSRIWEDAERIAHELRDPSFLVQCPKPRANEAKLCLRLLVAQSGSSAVEWVQPLERPSWNSQDLNEYDQTEKLLNSPAIEVMEEKKQ